MHLGPTEILQVFAHNNHRSEIQFVDGEQHTKFRVVYQSRLREGLEWRTFSPEYFETEQQAEEKARRWTFS